MIASRLVLWHTYSGGIAFDLSENRNQGTIVDAQLGAGAFADALQFQGGDGAVWVNPAPTLENLGMVRASVHFNWDPSAPGTRRHNLIEGHLAFALYINPDASLQGTILNSLGNWEGALSAPGTVPTGEWHTAEFVHDGISHCTLYLDGNVVAEGYSSPGPVTGVGPNGVAIGHWPEPDNRYSLEGYLDDVRVWCEDPVKDAGQLIDDCCIDRAAIAAQVGALKAQGVDAASLGASVQEMLQIGREGAYWLAEGSSGDRDAALGLASQLLLAFSHNDVVGLTSVVTAAGEIFTSRAPAGTAEGLWDRLRPVLESFPPAAAALKDDQGAAARAWAVPWCLDGWIPPSGRGKEPPRPTDNSLDPQTDSPDGTEPSGWADPGTHEQVPPPPDPGDPAVQVPAPADSDGES